MVRSREYEGIAGESRGGGEPRKRGETSAISDEVVAQKMLIHGRCDQQLQNEPGAAFTTVVHLLGARELQEVPGFKNQAL